jgi:hypothetical protein
MATGGAQVEVERRLREIGARLDSLPGSNKEILSLVEVSAPAQRIRIRCLLSFAVVVAIALVKVRFFTDKGQRFISTSNLSLAFTVVIIILLLSVSFFDV